jgi:hypothetical protein
MVKRVQIHYECRCWFFTNNCYTKSILRPRVSAFVRRAAFALLLSFPKGLFFLFPTFCLETKGGAKSSSRFKNGQPLRPTVASIESAICTIPLLPGPKDEDSSSCYAKGQKALYSPTLSLKVDVSKVSGE